jgi:hypothetical protein
MLPQLLLTLAFIGQSPDYDLLGPRLDRIEDQLDQISRKIDQAQDLVNQILAKSDRMARLAPQAASPVSDRPWQLSSEVRNGVETIMVQDDEGQSRTFIRRIVQPSAQAARATLTPTVTVRVVRPAPAQVAPPSRVWTGPVAVPPAPTSQLQQLLLRAAASPGCASGTCPLPTSGSGVSAGCANGTCGLR